MPPAAPPSLWRIAFTVPEALAPLFAEVAGDHADAVATFELEEGGLWLIEATAYDKPDAGRLSARLALMAQASGIEEPVLAVEELPPIDWVSHTYKGFPPIRAGRFDVRGSHIVEPPPAGSLSLIIDAATAFGTGEHGSTKGCLLALDLLSKRLKRPVGKGKGALDMGCGSGILALAMARRWKVPAVAADIDPEAVRVTKVNARINRLHPLVAAQGGDGYRTPLVRSKRPYGLITANILARPLARMAPALKRNLSPGGYVVLAGLLNRQANHVTQAHRAQGLVLERRIPVGEWTTLVLRRPAARPTSRRSPSRQA